MEGGGESEPGFSFPPYLLSLSLSLSLTHSLTHSLTLSLSLSLSRARSLSVVSSQVVCSQFAQSLSLKTAPSYSGNSE
jgi:hypothetical protein